MCQIEIPVTDVDRALSFYRDVFGWQRSAAEIHEYIVLEVPDDTAFGISLIPGHQVGSRRGPVLYFEVEDPECILRQAVAVGVSVGIAPRPLPGYGLIWHIDDPDGNRFGLYKRKSLG